MLARTVIGALLAFGLGTVAHEATHWLVAHTLGADIERVTLLSATPEVVYRAPTPGVDVAIRSSTVALSLPLLVAVILVSDGRPLPQQFALAVFAAAYLPRSGSDWQPAIRWVSHSI